MQYYSVELERRGGFEGDTLNALLRDIVTYYNDGDTRNAPQATSIILHTQDDEIELTPLEVAAFNKELRDDFDEAVIDSFYEHRHNIGTSQMTGRL